jgi:hypothetical protein
MNLSAFAGSFAFIVTPLALECWVINSAAVNGGF